MADLKLKQLEQQLKRIGCNYQFWGRSEVRELAHVLMEGEIVEHCVNGFYDGGFGMLAATNQRILIIDKKPFYLNLEDIRFDMISEIDFSHRLMDASVMICTPNKNMKFTAFNQSRARKLYQFAQKRVMEIRDHYSQQAQAPAPQYFHQQAFIAPPFQSNEWLQYAQQLAQAQQMPGLPGMPPMQTQQQAAPTSLPLPKRMAPIVSAYTRLPMRSRQSRFLGSRALN